MVYSDQLDQLNPALPKRQPLFRYGYAMDPDPVMACPDLSQGARLIYRGVLRLCGTGTTCRASVKEIARSGGVSSRTAKRHIGTLARRELIEVEKEPGCRAIFRLLPLPAWIVEGWMPILPEDLPEGERRKGKACPEQSRRGERENHILNAGEGERGTLSPCPFPLSPAVQGGQSDTPWVTDWPEEGCQPVPPGVPNWPPS